jgi:hypothetical protein
MGVRRASLPCTHTESTLSTCLGYAHEEDGQETGIACYHTGSGLLAFLIGEALSMGGKASQIKFDLTCESQGMRRPPANRSEDHSCK